MDFRLQALPAIQERTAFFACNAMGGQIPHLIQYELGYSHLLLGLSKVTRSQMLVDQ